MLTLFVRFSRGILSSGLHVFFVYIVAIRRCAAGWADFLSFFSRAAVILRSNIFFGYHCKLDFSARVAIGSFWASFIARFERHLVIAIDHLVISRGKVARLLSWS